MHRTHTAEQVPGGGRRDPLGRRRGRVARSHLRTAGQPRPAVGRRPRGRARPRAEPSLALRAHGGGGHAARPVDRRGARSRRWTRTATPPSSWPRTPSSGGPGFQHYEVSNYARPGHRARHNSAYWSRAPFLGLGPSAHSGWGRERQWNLREWAAYLSRRGRGCRSGRRARGAGRRGRGHRGAVSRAPDQGGPAGRTGSSPRPATRWVADGWAEMIGRPAPAHGRGVAPARRAGGPPGALPSRLVSPYISTLCLRRNN